MFGLFKRAGAATGAVADFQAAGKVELKTPLEQAQLLAVDVETTGLNPQKDLLLSIGWVPIYGRRIVMKEAGYVVLQQNGVDVAGSVAVHGITDDELAQGIPEAEAVSQVLAALKGKTMVAHFQNIEVGFLGHACKQHFGAAPQLTVIDTMALERRHLERMGTYPRGEDLRLPRVRERYNLPAYAAHNALWDALACAELYLALTEQKKHESLRGFVTK